MLAESCASTPTVSRLPVTTATTLKNKGWRSIMVDVRREGHLLVTNHDTPQAVILSPEEYERLATIAQKAADQRDAGIEALKLRFRQDMERLQDTGVHEIMEDLMLKPPKLNGRVIAGDHY